MNVFLFLYNIGWAPGFVCLYRLSLFIRARLLEI